MSLPWMFQTQKFGAVLSGTVEYEKPHSSSESFGEKLVFEAGQMRMKSRTSSRAHHGGDDSRSLRRELGVTNSGDCRGLSTVKVRTN